ncbi:MAG: hypothetical protein ACLT49_05770 [Sutterella wadsworthensis]
MTKPFKADVLVVKLSGKALTADKALDALFAALPVQPQAQSVRESYWCMGEALRWTHSCAALAAASTGSRDCV